MYNIRAPFELSWLLPENRASIFSEYCRQRYLLSAPPAAPSNRPTTLGQPLSPPTPGAINCSSIKISHFDRSSPFPGYRAYPWTLAPINPPFNGAHLDKQVISLERATRGSGCVLLGTARDLENERLPQTKKKMALMAGCSRPCVGTRVSAEDRRRQGDLATRATQRSLKPPAQGPPQEPCQAQSSSN